MNRSLLALLAIIIVGGGIYYYTQMRKPEAPGTDAAATTAATPATSENELENELIAAFHLQTFCLQTSSLQAFYLLTCIVEKK